MPLYGENEADLSMTLTVKIENLVKEFCFDKKAPISKLFNSLAINRLAQNLGLNVRVEEIPVLKDTPLMIEVLLNNKSSSEEKDERKGFEFENSFCERDLLY